MEILEDQFLDTEGVTEDSSFVDDIPTFDSLDGVECWLRTEKEFGISIPEEEVEKVVKVKDAKDADAVATEMMNGIDQRKWICVEADDLRVSAAGDTVVLIMVGSAHADAATAASITDAFSAAAGGLDLNKSK